MWGGDKMSLVTAWWRSSPDSTLRRAYPSLPLVVEEVHDVGRESEDDTGRRREKRRTAEKIGAEMRNATQFVHARGKAGAHVPQVKTRSESRTAEKMKAKMKRRKMVGLR